MMAIKTLGVIDGMKQYGLPNPSTPEDLCMRWNSVLTYGNRILLAGYFYMGKGEPSHYAAVYEFTSEDHSCEGSIELKTVTDVAFEDEGHAIEWCIHH